MPGQRTPIFWTFFSTLASPLQLGLFFGQLSRGVGWIQHCDVIVLEKFRFHRPNENTKTFFFLISTLDSVFEKLRFWSPFSPDTRGRKANPQRERCVFTRKRIRVDRAKICFCNAFLFVRHPAFGMLFTMLRLHWTIVHETIHKPNFWGRCSLLQPHFSEMFRPIPPKIQMCIRMR